MCFIKLFRFEAPRSIHAQLFASDGEVNNGWKCFSLFEARKTPPKNRQQIKLKL